MCSYTLQSYQKLDEITEKWGNAKICIFGSGKLGKGDAYEFLKLAGVQVDFFCDNSIEDEREIIDGIKSKPVSYLYENKDRIFIFVCLAQKYKPEIDKQFEEKGIKNYSYVNWNTIARVLDSVNKADSVVKKRYHQFYDDIAFLKYEFKKITGDELNLENPKTFNEKLQWLKLFNKHNPKYTKYVDKIALKKHIKQMLGDEYIIPYLGEWDNYDEIDFDGLPKQFVLKCTHDSGSIVIVKDKTELDHKWARELLNSRLEVNYYWMGREYPYKNAQRKIIAEEYLEDDFGELRDYKVFCFNGKAKYIQVDFDRFIEHKRNIYDINWNYVPLEIEFPTSPDAIIDKPRCLNEMICIAEKLSNGIIHVRVDFYIVKGRPIVGEMTFFHGGGMEKFTPNEWNYKLGSLIVLPDNNTYR